MTLGSGFLTNWKPDIFSFSPPPSPVHLPALPDPDEGPVEGEEQVMYEEHGIHNEELVWAGEPVSYDEDVTNPPHGDAADQSLLDYVPGVIKAEEVPPEEIK